MYFDGYLEIIKCTIWVDKVNTEMIPTAMYIYSASDQHNFLNIIP